MSEHSSKQHRASALVLMSGGIDSAACAHFLKDRKMNVSGLFVDYGQRAAALEIKAAKRIASLLEIPLDIVAIQGIPPSGSGELLGRNSLLIDIALFFSRGTKEIIAIGVHAGTPYYDCSSEFVRAIGQKVIESTDGRVRVEAPFVDWQKSDIYSYIKATKIPVSETYSCESGADPVCGHCLSCQDRAALGC